MGSTVAVSAEVGPVMATAVEAQPPENTALPVITGMTLVGETLTVSDRGLDRRTVGVRLRVAARRGRHRWRDGQ